MPIENRDLAPETRLVARHKGKQHFCTVLQTRDGLRYRVGDKEFNSPSSAGRDVTGGVAVNGWRFWSLEGTPEVRSAKATKPATAKLEKTAKGKGGKTVKPRTRGAKKSAKKKVARAASKDNYGCGVCPETFQTLKAATKHAMSHGSSR
jgi:hypothetical protein